MLKIDLSNKIKEKNRCRPETRKIRKHFKIRTRKNVNNL